MISVYNSNDSSRFSLSAFNVTEELSIPDPEPMIAPISAALSLILRASIFFVPSSNIDIVRLDVPGSEN